LRRISERIGVAKGKIGPVSRLILEALGILDCNFQATEFAHKVAGTTHSLFRTDQNQFFDDDRLVWKCSSLFPMSEVVRMNIDIMKFRECGISIVHVVRSEGRTDINPLAMADIRTYQFAFVVEDRLWKVVRNFSLERYVSLEQCNQHNAGRWSSGKFAFSWLSSSYLIECR